MCGICGIFGEGRTMAQRELIVRDMMDCMVHRGPDDGDFVSGQKFSVGHRRLSIIDLECGRQPIKSDDERYVLVFNGEIYNYVELREQLESVGIEFRTHSDSEVLLNVLIRSGIDGLKDLNGMYAFAFVDRNTGEWLIGRDHFGIKPLYYVKIGEEFVFASEIKAILEHPDVSATTNWKAMQQYLTFQFCLSGETLFEGVRALEPGTYIKGNGSVAESPVIYWDTNYKIDQDHTEGYFKDRILYLLEDSARLQIRSDVPLGSYLSGGIDSSVVATFAARHTGKGLPVFHGRFSESDAYDESCYARDVAESADASYFEVIPTAEDFTKHLPDLIYYLDEPVAGPGLFPQYMVSRLASEHVKVVLGGQGGDEIFGGYARYLVGYLEQALKGAIYETQEEGSFLVSLSSIIPNLPLLREYRPLMQQFWSKGLFEEMDARYFQLIDRSPDVETLLTEEAADRFDRTEVFGDFQKVFNYADTKSYVNKMTHFDQKTLLPALLQVEDRVSMSVSIESRVPILDRRIVDMVTSMPPPMKFQGGKTKHIFKQSIKNLLPSSVMERKDKMGFPVPLREWMRGGVVRDFVLDTLSSKNCRERGLFSKDAMDKLLDMKTPGGRQLWGALCLELWHERFIDQTA